MTTRPRLLPIALLGAAALALLIGAARFWPFTVDDAYITFRYARNIAHGFGPVYNRDGSRAEGYTSPLWTLLMVVPEALRLNTPTFAKILGIAALLGTMAVCALWSFRLLRFIRDTRRRVLVALLAPLFLACFPATPVHAVSGMETALFTLLLTAFLYNLFRAPRSRWPLCVLLGLLLALTRPEGNLAVVVGLGAALLSRRRRGFVPTLRTGILLYALPYALYFLWRWRFYGHPLPLPFYVKIEAQRLLAGAGDVRRFVLYLAGRGSVLLLLGLWRLIPQRRMLPPLLAALSLLLFFLFPAHIMGYQWRYLYPLVPATLVLTVTGAGVFTAWARSVKAGTALPLAASLLICLLFLSDMPAFWHDRMTYATGLSRAHIALGRQIAEIPQAENLTVALADAGALPYFSGCEAIDTLGLNEDHIAVTGHHDPGYILGERHPDIVVLVSTSADEFAPFDWNDYESDLYDACRKRGMVRVQRRVFDPDEYFLWVMADPKSPAGRYLREHEPGEQRYNTNSQSEE